MTLKLVILVNHLTQFISLQIILRDEIIPSLAQLGTRLINNPLNNIIDVRGTSHPLTSLRHFTLNLRNILRLALSQRVMAYGCRLLMIQILVSARECIHGNRFL